MRLFLVVAAAAVTALWVACGSTDDAAPVAPPPAADDDDGPEMDGDDLDGDAGAPPAPGDPSTTVPSKIRYVLVLVKENHTFDNYFNDFPGADPAPKTVKQSTKIITRTAAPNELMKDICHSNTCGQDAYD